MHPSIAVVVTCYNKGPWIDGALASLAAQTTAAREIVVVDDGSTDDSVARTAAFAAAHPALPLRILRQPNSGQPAHARNAGIATVTSEVVICLDADDTLSPLYLDAVGHAFAADPSLGLVYPDGIAFGTGAPRAWQSQAWDAARLAQTNLCPCVTAFRRRIWASVGGYRANVRGYEDWDFWIAAGALGERGLRLPLPLFHYRELESGVYASTHARDLLLRASIVTNNPGCYGATTRALAAAIAAGAPFDAMAVWGSLDEILRTGCATAAHAAAREELAWAAGHVAAGTAAATLATLQRQAPMDAATARCVGALLHVGGDTAR
ncbi:MAG: glycosyltransferase family 2 protein, partial [Gemmatimonadaceae bacterium]|nr:glycosyltransferase family 2 protein [Gemmatimonadaceae bacterium]